jgi:hypothetical protein
MQAMLSSYFGDGNSSGSDFETDLKKKKKKPSTSSSSSFSEQPRFHGVRYLAKSKKKKFFFSFFTTMDEKAARLKKCQPITSQIKN